jgi:hypothetical protein
MNAPALWLLTLMTLLARPLSAQRPLFAPAADSRIAVTGAPNNVAIADLNYDKKLDIVVARGNDKSVTVLLGQGDGHFRAGPTVALPNGPGEMALGDVNGDGKLDLAATHHDSYGVMLLLGNGKGGFALAPSSPIVMREGEHPHTHGLGLGDLNGDGNLDLATANNEDNDISVSLGDGRGGFSIAAGSPFAVAGSPYPLTLADLDADGDLDIISTNTGFGPASADKPAPRELTILWGDGRGGFRRSAAALRTESPWFAAVADINGDRQADLVATHAERNELTVLLGNGRGGFSEVAGSPFDLGHSAWAIALALIAMVGSMRLPRPATTCAYSWATAKAASSLRPARRTKAAKVRGDWRLAISTAMRKLTSSHRTSKATR